MRTRFVSLLLVLLLIGGAALQLQAHATEQPAISCGIPLQTAGEWPTGSPEEAGLDAAILCSLTNKLDKSPEMNVHSVVVVKGGKLIFETYRGGQDNKWGTELEVKNYTSQMQHDVRSISKSVVSLLFGIALDQKLIASIDDPVFDYFPEYVSLRTPSKERIRLRHLLTMTSGLAWDELRPYTDPKNSERKMMWAAETFRFVLEQPVWQNAGEKWNYSGGDTQLLAGVLQRTTHKRLVTFAKEALFEPLGITHYEWLNMPSGVVAGASGLRLRPRDMAKIGQLVLNKGSWQGRRIISEKWIRESTEEQVHAYDAFWYGYQWWMNKVGNRQISWIAAKGLGGQRIFIVPAFDLVVVITAGLYSSESQDSVSFDLFDKHVLRALEK